jgi:ankyrin repeat protein
LAFGQTKDEQLFLAVMKNDSAKVETYLDNGADPNFKVKKSFLEMSMLIRAAQNNDIKIVKLLIQHKVEVDFRDVWKETALMYAAHFGNKAIVGSMLANGADQNAKDDQGNSVLSATKESKNEEVIKLIGGLQKN